MAWKKGLKVEHSAGSENKATEFSPIKKCQDCHLGPQAIYPFPFDLSSVKEWENYLSKADDRSQAREWMASVIGHLENQTMPPKPFSTHLKKKEVEALLTFLKTAKDKTD